LGGKNSSPGPVLVYSAIPNVDRDAEAVGEIAGRAG
jgi:hypothetical protein